MMGLQEVYGKQRANLGRLSESPQSKRLVLRGSLVSPERGEECWPKLAVWSAHRYVGLSLIPYRMARKSLLDMVLILMLVLINPDSLL